MHLALRTLARLSIMVLGLVPNEAAADGVSAAPAQPRDPDTSLPETLFREGKELMDKGDFDAACPKLSESQRLDPASGTLLSLALCHEAQGKTASAWAEFNDTIPLARIDDRPDRANIARRHVSLLEPLLSRIRVVVPRARSTVGLEVRLDGTPLAEAAWDVAAPVNPGEHVVEAVAPGYDGVRIPVRITPSTLTEVPIPPLVLHADHRDVDRGKTQRFIAFGTGGAGVTLLGVGTYLLVRAVTSESAANARCPTQACADREAVRLNGDARSSADWATSALAIGAANVALATILFITAPRATRHSAGGKSGSFLSTLDRAQLVF
jgi:hypothetical protein